MAKSLKIQISSHILVTGHCFTFGLTDCWISLVFPSSNEKSFTCFAFPFTKDLNVCYLT